MSTGKMDYQKPTLLKVYLIPSENVLASCDSASSTAELDNCGEFMGPCKDST